MKSLCLIFALGTLVFAAGCSTPVEETATPSNAPTSVTTSSDTNTTAKPDSTVPAGNEATAPKAVSNAPASKSDSSKAETNY